MKPKPHRKPYHTPSKTSQCPAYAPFGRVLGIARLLRTQTSFAAPKASDELGGSTRTIRRDIRFLRSLGWKIQWDTKEMTYTLLEAPPPEAI